MKKTYTAIFSAAIAALALSAASCASTGSTVSQDSSSGTSLATKNTYATKLGDFDPISLPDIMSLGCSFNKLNPRELTKNYLVPRTNKIEIYYREGVNSMCLILPESTRHAILDSIEKFRDGLDEGTLVDEKATEKNAFATGSCDVWWGVMSPSMGAELAKMCINCKFMDDKAYFVLRVPSAQSTKPKGEWSPYTEIYFSPSQLDSLAELLDQEKLQGLVQQKIDKAMAY